MNNLKLIKEQSKAEILKSAFDLEKTYPELSFKHHCYLRIAYDNCVQDKWNNVIKAPFMNNCNFHDFVTLGILLDIYKNNKVFLLRHNTNSLNYRNK